MQAENEQLKLRLGELSANVEMRDSVYQARNGRSLVKSAASNQAKLGKKKKGGIVEASPASIKMKSIVSRRRLTDLVRAQSDEIEFLKHELERLRERNFPRFAKPSAAFAEREFVANPDVEQKR